MAEKTEEQKTIEALQKENKEKDKKIEQLEKELKNINVSTEKQLSHKFAPIPGVGVLITTVYGDNISTCFVQGVKVKGDDMVSINAD